MTEVHVLLSLRDLSVRFGGIVAISGLDLDIREGTIYAVIGPNGAGKSTLINVISGVCRPTSGAVTFAQEPVQGAAPFQLARRGIARTFQNTELFGDMTALDNVLTGMHRHLPYGPLASSLRLPGFRRAEKNARARALELLDLVGLADTASQSAASLPFASQRRLEVARALAAQPRLLLLDEPAAGLRAGEIETQRVILRTIAAELKLTILLIDHVMPLVMQICDRISVLNFGRKIAEGTPQEIVVNPAVLEAYLGMPKAVKHAAHS